MLEKLLKFNRCMLINTPSLHCFPHIYSREGNPVKQRLNCEQSRKFLQWNTDGWIPEGVSAALSARSHCRFNSLRVTTSQHSMDFNGQPWWYYKSVLAVVREKPAADTRPGDVWFLIKQQTGSVYHSNSLTTQKLGKLTWHLAWSQCILSLCSDL